MAHYECIFESREVVSQYVRLRYIPDFALLTIGGICVGLAETLHQKGGFARILDAGAGSGRFALPCAEAAKNWSMRLQLLAVDLSRRMLVQLHGIWREAYIDTDLECVQADLQEPLPFQEASVHVAYTVATFHILQQWRAALEGLLNVLMRGGYLVFIQEINQFMHQTEGFDNDRDLFYVDEQLHGFMAFYHKRREECGEPYIPSEVRYSDMSAALRYLTDLGMSEVESGADLAKLRWDKPHTYGDILHCFRHRQMTTWGSDLSAEARSRIADSLEEWVDAHGIDRDKVFHLPAALIPHVFQKGA